ncbi:MAG: anthranilate synthase component I [Chloroflexaceae bacterium]|nr:anthranilate synthase component I [Chloroflexaceae bacterium]NJO04558.1 anthranilate synthase component I [Chloroflexaceae bacterium]
MYYPTRAEVETLRTQGNLCPIYREILADLETPVSAYLKIARGSSHSFLLESVEGGQHIARYSFLGSNPYLVLRMDGGTAHAVQGGYKQVLPYTDPLVVLGSYLREYRPVRLPDLPRFVGGAVGYMSYETVNYFEERLPHLQGSDYTMPEAIWMFVDTLLVFDHLRHRIQVVSHVHLDTDDLDAEYQRGIERIEQMIKLLRQPLTPGDLTRRESAGERGDVRSNVSSAQYETFVERAKAYIMAGDIFQVVPSQRFRRPTSADSFSIYRALRTINPSPYMFYIHAPEGDLVGASPELLVRVIDGEVTTHPIAGTRPRGKTLAEDATLAEELIQDEKEIAEHLMLVDLGRNDIGRVSVPGSVTVPVYMSVEKYSHVMHIVSHVTGRLRSDLHALDALRACFPAGTVSGAPKIRAMEIISELEGIRRGIYAGCAGYINFNGDLDTCISLRTMVVQHGVAYVQAGGGVVADSDPATEYHESCNKAAALLRAIEMAEELT